MSWHGCQVWTGPNVRSAFYEKRKEIYLVVFSEFWLKWLEAKLDLCILVPKMVDRWP